MSTAGADEAPPEDDESVDDDADLFRRVPPQHWKRADDGTYQVRDGAFKNFPQPHRKRMSIALGDTLDALQRQPESVLRPEDVNFGLVALKAKDVRALQQVVDRTPEANEPAHGDVYGDKPGGTRKALARVARWIVYPPAEPGA